MMVSSRPACLTRFFNGRLAPDRSRVMADQFQNISLRVLEKDGLCIHRRKTGIRNFNPEVAKSFGVLPEGLRRNLKRQMIERRP